MQLGYRNVWLDYFMSRQNVVKDLQSGDTLTLYASIGYKVKGELIESESVDIIFDKSNFLPVYSKDIVNAQKEILIVSPYTPKADHS